MICLSIFVEQYETALQALQRHGRKIDAVELRLDSADRATIEQAIAAIPRPLILTCRPPSHGGLFPGTEAERVALLRTALRYRPLYTDVELGSAAETLLEENPGQPYILSFHDIKGTPGNLGGIAAALSRRSPAVVKLVTHAASWSDNLKILEVADSMRNQGQNFICLCTGEKGIYSRVAARARGSAITYCTAEGATLTGAGQLNIGQAIDLFRLREVTPDWKIYGIVGHPVGHSLSPAFHNGMFARYGIEAVYLPFPADSFDEFMQFASEAEIAGLSVTAPHKTAAATFAEPGEESVRVAKAANTLVRRGDGYISHNTDGPAFVAMLSGKIGKVAGRRVMIIGTGGAARMLAFDLLRAGAEVMLCGRNVEKGIELASLLGCEFTCAPEELASADVVVNATTVAREEQDTDDFLKNRIPVGALAVDLHYDPPEPYFLKEASMKACRTTNGLEIFRRQAALQFKLWTGIELDQTAVDDIPLVPL